MHIEDPLFSPENLRRLAELQRLEDEEDAAKGFCSSARNVVEGPRIDINALLGLDEQLRLPVRVNMGDQLCDKIGKIEAEVHLTISADMKAFTEALKIGNRSERILKMRDLIHFDAQPVMYLMVPK